MPALAHGSAAMRTARFMPIAVLLLLACTGPADPEDREPVYSDEPVHRLTLGPDKSRIDVGDLLLMQVVAYNAAGRVIQRPRLTWTTSDPTIASVGETGVVRGVSAGYITVRVQAGTASAFTTLYVQVAGKYPDVVLVEPAALALTSCTTQQFTARTSPDIGDSRFAWRSSNPEIAQVNATGRVTGAASGSVVITVMWAPDTSRRAVRSGIVQACP